MPGKSVSKITSFKFPIEMKKNAYWVLGVVFLLTFLTYPIIAQGADSDGDGIADE